MRALSFSTFRRMSVLSLLVLIALFTTMCGGSTGGGGEDSSQEAPSQEGADIVIGNAEFMGLPLVELADKYPDVYFGSVIASDLTTRPNFIRFFPRQYQALYLCR